MSKLGTGPVNIRRGIYPQGRIDRILEDVERVCSEIQDAASTLSRAQGDIAEALSTTVIERASGINPDLCVSATAIPGNVDFGWIVGESSGEYPRDAISRSPQIAIFFDGLQIDARPFFENILKWVEEEVDERIEEREGQRDDLVRELSANMGALKTLIETLNGGKPDAADS